MGAFLLWTIKACPSLEFSSALAGAAGAGLAVPARVLVMRRRSAWQHIKAYCKEFPKTLTQAAVELGYLLKEDVIVLAFRPYTCSCSPEPASLTPLSLWAKRVSATCRFCLEHVLYRGVTTYFVDC